ncbi:PAS/PAC sensor hybrid histidine kinase [Caballeronia glebae]|uniref:histidine kinase n=1 Tax=Caballeronia glebae TaxID=1777143 RepID=A0A158AQG6_9BURK|nr:ATP-binding protein [Caballeronia glebae]SAK59995.1 PAS/PAC sensor hybrid histidine kinase [Caballeronia glebae]
MQAFDSNTDAYDRAPCGLVTTKVDGTIVRANTTFYRWCGFDAAELIGARRIQDLLTVGGRVFHQTHLAPLLLMQRAVSEVKLDIRHRAGHKVPMLINAMRHGEGDAQLDDFAFFIVTDRDKYEQELLTMRLRAEESLEAKQQAELALQAIDRRKDEFLATLAHELRNPLAPIQAVVALLRKEELLNPQAVWSRGVLERQVRQIARLVDDLLEVSRVAEGKLELRRERVDLNAVIRQSIEGSRNLINASSHTLRLTLPDSPILLTADPARLTQVIQNLINNAAKYTPTGGMIEVAAARQGDEALITVRDNGIGISAEHLPTIFGIFAQLAPAISRAQGGLGIGLSLVRALVERHRGTVSVTSEGIGQGSEFVVRLPISLDQTDYALPSTSRSASVVQSRRILVIDDNEDAALSLAMLLDSDGHDVHTAHDGASGLKQLLESVPEVVLLDIGLPDVNGYELAKRIRQLPEGRDALLIALTGWGQEQDKLDALAAGFDKHLIKPVDYPMLLDFLR